VRDGSSQSGWPNQQGLLDYLLLTTTKVAGRSLNSLSKHESAMDYFASKPLMRLVRSIIQRVATKSRR